MAENNTYTFRKLTVHSDPRGCVFEPLDVDDLPRQKNVHVVLTRPGAVRGNHYHVRGTEIITVTGAALVRLRVGGKITDVNVQAGEAVQFRLPAGVSHAIRNSGEQDNILVAFNTETHDPAGQAVVTDMLIA